MSTIKDYYSDQGEFEHDLRRAIDEACSRRELEFVESLRNKFEEWGMRMFFSESQHNWLMRILGEDLK